MAQPGNGNSHLTNIIMPKKTQETDEQEQVQTQTQETDEQEQDSQDPNADASEDQAEPELIELEDGSKQRPFPEVCPTTGYPHTPYFRVLRLDDVWEETCVNCAGIANSYKQIHHLKPKA